MAAQSTYAFKARDGSGELVGGTMVAGSTEEVTARLRSEGKFVVAIEANPLRAAPELNRDQLVRNEAAKAVRREDVIAFAQQISIMLETGVPLFEAMRAFTGQTRRREFRMVLDALCHDVESGEPMSRGLEKWPRVFPGIMVSLVKASEASGKMAKMLGRVGEYLSKERRTMKQIKGALAYPCFMVVSGVAITVFLMSWVLPRFDQMWQGQMGNLPWITRFFLTISRFLTTQWWWFVPALAAASLAGFIWVQTRRGRRVADWLRLNLPVLRTMYRHLYITRAARTMSTLLAAGVNVLDVIDICRGITGNVYYDDLWNRMEDGVREGKQISDGVSESALVPANVSSMIQAGERSGQLPEVMEKIADFSEGELDDSVAAVTSLIEPLMIVIMGGIVGAIAIALIWPIMEMRAGGLGAIQR